MFESETELSKTIGSVFDAARLVNDAIANRHGVRASMPAMLTHTVTFGCNAKCVMCDSWQKPTEGDLSLEQIARVYEKLPRMLAVRLTGGEPWVRQDFSEILRLAEQKLQPRYLHVTTNGFLTDRILKTCSDSRRETPLDVLVSLDGVGEKHNTIRGNRNAYRTCMETISELAKNRTKWNLRVAVNQTVIDAEGVDHYKQLRDELDKLDVRVHLIIAYSGSATYSTQAQINMAPREVGSFDTFGDFTDEKLRELFEAFAADLPNFDFKERIAKQYYLEGIRNRLLHDIGSPNPPCVALSSHLRLFPNGDVPICQMNTETVGNLNKDSFEAVWFGTEALEKREWVRGCPGCWAECEVVPSAVFSADLLLPKAFRKAIRSSPQSSRKQQDPVSSDSTPQSEPRVYQLQINPRGDQKPDPCDSPRLDSPQ
jgi:MoaA/NifB/PqqE/SkfB family radical SAM enzyme